MSEPIETARPHLSAVGVTPIMPPTQEPAAVEPAAVEILTPLPAQPNEQEQVGNMVRIAGLGGVRIAGLGSMVQGVRDQISGLRSELPALGQSITALRSSIADVKSQVDAVHDDLKFEATTLGNGSGS